MKILIKIYLWRQVDTRSIFFKKMKNFWEIKEKKNIKIKKKEIECYIDIKNGVVKRKIKKKEKLKKNIKQNVMKRWKMVWLREK